jgi:peptide deformylase
VTLTSIGGMELQGVVRPITIYGDPVLHRPCAPVAPGHEGLRQLVADMFASMYAADGVGLAANQIGVGLRIFVIDCPDHTGEHTVGHVVNPVLHLPEGRRELIETKEGCLSVPGASATLARLSRAVVTGTDVDGNPVTIEGAGMVARCLQHECDHLDGTVYVDRLAKRDRKAALSAADLSGVTKPPPLP